MMPIKNYMLLGYMLINGIISYGQISGTIMSEHEQVIPYANIIALTDPLSGTTTDEQGVFKLAYHKPVQLYISAVGYRDTIVQVYTLKENVFILKTKIYQLEEVTVTSTPKKPFIIGPFDAQPQEEGWKHLYPGQPLGIFYKPTNKEIHRKISSIQVYISSKGKYNTPMGIRILSPFKRHLKKNQTIPTSEFYDLLSETITFTPDSPGWQEINLNDYSIPIPRNGIFILFYPLDNGDRYRWKDEGNQFYYGAVIATSSNAYNLFNIAGIIVPEKKIYIISNSLLSDSKPMITIKL